LASTETKVESAPESVSVNDIRSAFEEIEKSPTEPPPILASAPAPPGSDSISFDKPETELNPEDFHLRFNQANSFAQEVNEAASSLLQITDTVKVAFYLLFIIKKNSFWGSFGS
jgi:hypothetical protein